MDRETETEMEIDEEQGEEMAEPTEIEQRFARLQEMAQRLVDESDPQRILELSEEMSVEVAALKEIAVAFEEQMSREARDAAGVFEVVLTPDQRRRILEATGVEMHTVIINDPSGDLVEEMVRTDPEAIEREALRQAELVREAEPGLEEARHLAEEALAELEAQGEWFAAEARALREDAEFRRLVALDGGSRRCPS